MLDLVLAPAQKLGLKVAAHIEPPPSRNSNSIMGDYQYLRAKGIRDFYIYQAQSMSNTALRAVNDANSDDRIFGEAANEAGVRDGSFAQWLQDAHFNGLYTYDPRGFKASEFGGICDTARAHALLCMPSVGPGWDATRATKITAVVKRANGAVYDQYWQAAIDAHADIVTITSYNEWHEGTQIEASALSAFRTTATPTTKALMVKRAKRPATPTWLAPCTGQRWPKGLHQL